jgi:hypothetical protein
MGSGKLSPCHRTIAIKTLQASVAADRINLLLYYGVLGARAAWRAEVVPRETSGGGEAALKEPATEPASVGRR